ncbi:MAG: GHKL domain-containing protein [Tenericutes bacterium]|nr:GHKL domain-containing protein [Mycoplasmatota bacterium]
MVTKYSIDFSSKTYFLNLVLLVIFLLLISISIFNSIKRQHELEKIDALLDFISKYEKIIDEDRMHKHELLNNLLILKSYKNSKEYKIALNDLIDTYDSNKNISIKNICKLPAGLKGIIYYKIKNSNCEKLRTQIHITKEASLLLENLEQKKYTSLCKIFCIHLDNSLEASINSKEKELFISIYKENTYIVIEIENTFQDKIDLKMIYKEKYSTKENSRGIGLFIAKLIEKNNKNITTSNIVVNDMFISQIKIKVD